MINILSHESLKMGYVTMSETIFTIPHGKHTFLFVKVNICTEAICGVFVMSTVNSVLKWKRNFISGAV